MDTKNSKTMRKQIDNILVRKLNLHIFSTTVLLYFLTFSISTKAQLNSFLLEMDSTTDMQSIKTHMEPYLDNLRNEIDSVNYYAGGGEYKCYNKFIDFWNSRTSPNSNISTYFDAEYNFHTNLKRRYKTVTQNPWKELGPNKLTQGSAKGNGPTEFVTFFNDGTPESTDYLLTGSLNGGLFYSTNGGENWSNAGTDTQWHMSGCSWAVFHPDDHTKWIASSSGNDHSGHSLWIRKSGGVYRTVDEGANWQKIADYTNFHNNEWLIIYKLLISPTDPNLLYVATSAGVYMTTNLFTPDPDAVSWTKVYDHYTYDIEFKPDNSNVIYATTFMNAEWKIIQTSNQFTTYESIPSSPVGLTDNDPRNNHITIEVSVAKPDFLYCFIRKSRKTWLSYYNLQNSTTPNSIFSFDEGYYYGWGHGFGVDQTTGEEIIVSKNLYLGKYNIYTGSQNISTQVHADVEDVVFNPLKPNEVWICTHGGVEKHTNKGYPGSWEAKYIGLGVAMTASMATSFTEPQYILAGFYHDYSQITNTEFSSEWDPEWEFVYGGDGERSLIDNIEPNHMWCSWQKGHWLYSDDYFDGFTSITQSRTSWNTEGVLNKQNPATIFRNIGTDGFQEVFRSTDRGKSTGQNG